MNLTTHIQGYRLICIREYEQSLHDLKKVCEQLSPLRNSLLNDIKVLESRDKNSFAKTIRLLDRFNKMVEEVCRTQL